MGHRPTEAECGFKVEARTTLQSAMKAIPDLAGDFSKDMESIRTLSEIVHEQAGSGAREDARKTVEVLLAFSEKFFQSTKIRNARDVAASTIASALADIGDFEAAFRRSEAVANAGRVLGEIAAAASTSLDREDAHRFIHEAADRLAKLESGDDDYMGLGHIATAQAQLGEIEEAKQSASAIGERPSRGGYDMTDGRRMPCCALLWCSTRAGDSAGARKTLREAFEVVRDHPKMRGRDGRYYQIAGAQIAGGDLGDAWVTVGAMSGKRAEILAHIAHAQAATGNDPAARKTFAFALSDAGLSVKNPPAPNPDLAEAFRLSQNMPAIERSEPRGDSGDVWRHSGWLKTVRSIDEPNYQRNGLQKVISARATAGDVATALRLGLAEFRRPDERRAALEGAGRHRNPPVASNHLTSILGDSCPNDSAARPRRARSA